jgi:hypothetical protein
VQSDKGIDISKVGGDVIGTGVSGSENIIAKMIQIENFYNQSSNFREQVFYIVLPVDHANLNSTLHQIAAAINVRLNENDNEYIPFIPPKMKSLSELSQDFSDFKNKNKLLVWGVRGSGKSRCLYEIVKEKIADFQRVLIINPQRGLGTKSETKTISELVSNEIQQMDVVIWNKFPDGFVVQQNKEDDALINISSADVSCLIISLKSEYLELYRGKISSVPELFVSGIDYDKEDIKQIVKSYGNDISRFNEVYTEYVEKDIDAISDIIVGREATPSAVRLYYEGLIEQSTQKKKVDAVNFAQDFELSMDYYSDQFNKFIRNERPKEAGFLYTLKLCYELELERIRPLMMKLQKEIFGSDFPDDPLHHLSGWIYFSSGKYYSMQDVARSAITIPQDLGIVITDFLSNNFEKIVSTADASLYSFGLFLGQNIQSIHCDNPDLFIPERIYNYMEKKESFAWGLAEGIAKHILDPDNKELLIDILTKVGNKKQQPYGKSIEFLVLYRLTVMFPSGTDDFRSMILKEMENETESAESMGFGIGMCFSEMSRELQSLVLDNIKKHASTSARVGFVNSIRYIFSNKEFIFIHADKQMQDFFMTQIKEDSLLSMMVGSSLGLIFFDSVEANLQKELVTRNDRISWGIGQRIALFLKNLREERFDKVMQWLKDDAAFAQGFGTGFVYSFRESSDNDFINRVWKMLETNKDACKGFGDAIAKEFSHLNDEQKNNLLNRAKENHLLSTEVGLSLGEYFHHLDKTDQNKIFEISQDTDIEVFLFGALAKNFTLQDKDVRDRVMGMVGTIMSRVGRDERIDGVIGFNLAYFLANTENERVGVDIKKQISELRERNQSFEFGLVKGMRTWLDHHKA